MKSKRRAKTADHSPSTSQCVSTVAIFAGKKANVEERANQQGGGILPLRGGGEDLNGPFGGHLACCQRGGGDEGQKSNSSLSLTGVGINESSAFNNAHCEYIRYLQIHATICSSVHACRTYSVLGYILSEIDARAADVTLLERKGGTVGLVHWRTHAGLPTGVEGQTSAETEMLTRSSLHLRTQLLWGHAVYGMWTQLQREKEEEEGRQKRKAKVRRKRNEEINK